MGSEWQPPHTNERETEMATRLENLLESINRGDVELTDSLPVFGDADWNNPTGVWSWDEHNMIVGTCVSDLRIEQR